MKKVSTRTEQQLCMLTILTYAAVAAQLNNDNSWRLRRRLGLFDTEKANIRKVLKKILPNHFDFTVVRWPGTDSKDDKDVKYKRSGCYATSYLVKSNSGFPKKNCLYVIQVCNNKNICPAMKADEVVQAAQFKQKCIRSKWFESVKLQGIVSTVAVDAAVHEKKGCPQWMISEYGLDTSDLTMTVQGLIQHMMDGKVPELEGGKLIFKEEVKLNFKALLSLFEVYIQTIMRMHNELGIAWGDGHNGNVLIKTKSLFSGREMGADDLSLFDWDRCEKLAGKTKVERKKLLANDSELFRKEFVMKFYENNLFGNYSDADKILHLNHRIEGKTFPQILIELQKAKWTESEYLTQLFSVTELTDLSSKTPDCPGLNALARTLRENCEMYTDDYNCASLREQIEKLLPQKMLEIDNIFRVPMKLGHVTGIKPPSSKVKSTPRARSLSAPRPGLVPADI